MTQCLVNCLSRSKSVLVVLDTDGILISLSDGIHPSPCCLPLWQCKDGEVPPAAAVQRQQQDQGEHLPLDINGTTLTQSDPSISTVNHSKYDLAM